MTPTGEADTLEPALVLVHALTQDGNAWQFVKWAGALTPTIPGHGPGEEQKRTLGDMADELVQNLPARFDIVGVAFGGHVAQQILVRYPARVRSAVFACSTASVGNPETMRARADDARRRGIPAMKDELLARWFTPAALAANIPGARYARARLDVISTEAYALAIEASAGHETTSELGGVTQPVTLIVGLDDHVGRSASERMAEQFPQFRTREIPGPHMIHLEQPDLLRAEIQEHLSWVDKQEQGLHS
ncbi:MAG: alpha/beta fold hydrolase [Acidimicrobiaceae bacterium]|nr:alpha/beta fold hydrolase [Acidimicrobiaceae bacterium]